MPTSAPASSTPPTVVGAGAYRYRPTPSWEQLPEGWRFLEVAGVATDSRGRLLVFNRGEHPITILNPDGSFAGSLGEGLFTRPHGLHVGPDDALYCTDDDGH